MPGEATAREFAAKLNDIIFLPIIFLLSGIALIIFLWGGFIFVTNAGNETARADGKRKMMYGLIGMLVMISAYAILTVVAGTFGLDRTLDNCAFGGPCITR